MKKLGIILLILGVTSLLVYLIIRMLKPTDNSNTHITATEQMNKKQFTEQDGKDAILQIQKEYGTDTAKLIEKMMRLETAHFKSGQYKLTGSAGMEQGKWQDIPTGATDGYIEIKDNQDGHLGKFIVWHSVTDFARYLAEYIKRHDNNYARWNSTKEPLQAEYRKRVNEIKSRFV